MDLFQKIAAIEIGGNSLFQFFLVAVFFVLILWILPRWKKVLISQIRKFAKSTGTQVDDLLVDLLKKVGRGTFLIAAVFIASRFLNLPENLKRIARFAFLAVVLWHVARAAVLLASFAMEKIAEREKQSAGTVRFLSRFLSAAIWLLAGILFLQNVGIDVSGLVAGLGISGIAVALAAQNVLGDLFAGISIFLDKPFAVSDFVEFGSFGGTVEKIGIKTTRLRALSGEEIVVPNKNLTDEKILNFSNLKTRTGKFVLGVEYSTSTAQLKKIPELIRAAAKGISNLEITLVHFREFGDFSLNFEIAFCIDRREIGIFRDRRAELNLAIWEIFEKEKIEFAFPTRKILLQKTDTQQVSD